MKSWAVLSDEQMSNGWSFSLLNDEQMSNKVRVEHQPESKRVFFVAFRRNFSPTGWKVHLFATGRLLQAPHRKLRQGNPGGNSNVVFGEGQATCRNMDMLEDMIW